MHLVLDIGNTSVTYGLYRRNQLTIFGSCLFNDIPKKIKIWSKNGAIDPFFVVISSVVPKNTDFLKKSLGDIPNIHLLIAGENLPVPILHKYASKNKLGIDRLVTAFGAIKIYGAPALIIDYGTAVTFDYVSAQKIFEGGMIIPGPELAFQALIARAALLPKKIRLPRTRKSFLGRTTKDCLTSGILEGYGAMTDALIMRFKKLDPRVNIIATGGFSLHLKPFAPSLRRIDPRLSVKALHLLFHNWQRAHTPR